MKRPEMRGQYQIALTEGDRHLIGLVSRFRLLSRDQLMTLALFRSLTRVGEARAVTAQQFFNAVWLAARGTTQVRH